MKAGNIYTNQNVQNAIRLIEFLKIQRVKRSGVEWRSCITKMIEKSSSWITPEEGEQIITEILGTKKDVIGIT